MCGLYRKGAASPGTQWSAGDNDEGHTRAKRDRMSAADAERPQRVAKQARMHPNQPTTSQRRKRKGPNACSEAANVEATSSQAPCPSVASPK